MVTLQWGTAIGYDILVFDKQGHVAFLEVKSSATYSRRWILQEKYARPEEDRIPLDRRFICCVNLALIGQEPDVYIFPANVVAKGLHYFFTSRFPKSSSYHLSLDFKPQGRTKLPEVKTVGEEIGADLYLENYGVLGIQPVVN